jgi:hypothetical protein
MGGNSLPIMTVLPAFLWVDLPEQAYRIYENRLEIRRFLSPAVGKVPAPHSERKSPSSDAPGCENHRRFFNRLDL